MYAAVPRIEPVWVFKALPPRADRISPSELENASVRPTTFASPQSMTNTSPKSPTITFSGLRSRCTTPRLCA